MINVRKPNSASAAPKLMAVVVLPTPPFWSEMAKTTVSEPFMEFSFLLDSNGVGYPSS
jgi:hypothetical protein